MQSMRTVRLVLALLLTLVLPINGIASVLASSEPCPMEQMPSPDHGCCEDDAGSLKMGKICKPGQECKTTSLLQVDLGRTNFPAPVALATTFSDDPLLSNVPSGVWRPPRV